ncbi:hypothetical protein QFC19_003625 [Naganishia cerealis]|uniref:Uncharacterized protein n=1 Tax=Naganishia cerealis TaxID=610337 RepID=A0ACC2W230_9TREE|nr:hypothetical protein QFC19_003625 [Naganishia cerealis]
MGDYHSVACDHAGAAFAWGENTAGQLGRGEMGSRNVGDLSSPTLISFGRGDESPARNSVATSAKHMAADRIQRETNGDFKPAFKSRRFVFDVAAGGWQSGALVVDLQDYCLQMDEPLRAIQSSSQKADALDAEDPPTADDNTYTQQTPIATAIATPSNQQSAERVSDERNPSQNVDLTARQEEVSEPRQTDDDLINPQMRGVPIRGLQHIRIGYAGRGAVRGGRGFQIPRGM